MNIQPSIKTFVILPFISVKRYKNTLSEAAKKDFGINWKDFYTIEAGWLFWVFEFKI